MNEQTIVSKIHEYLHIATKELCTWLSNMLPRVGEDWWQTCVMDNLSVIQRQFAEENGYSKLDDLDLAALLRVTDKSWYDMRSFAYLPTRERQCVRDMMKVRNNWAHLSVAITDKDIVLRDLDIILSFFEGIMVTNKYTQGINELKHDIENTDFSAVFNKENDNFQAQEPSIVSDDIHERDKVYLTGSPDTIGMVFSISDVSGTKKYEVFVDGETKTFYEGQIQKIDSAPSYSWIDLNTLQSNLTAYEINNPSAGNLYSLNAARIDFVPYQFRPALKLIKSDEPKILIADSVGVGKTIEAGLIIKELEARNELDNILIICPKPLVAERKWELEMRRFDEDFIPLDGTTLRQVISDTHRDEEWPVHYNKAIIPYSILDSRVLEGEDQRRGRQYGLNDLDPAPHFDLVIVDEAHHIRNGSLDKEKAYAYKCVRYFCEHADAVVMLTATPLQTSNDDLFTLMNLLRPDIIIDKEVFQMMSRPNEYIYQASHAIRGAGEGWRETTIAALQNVKSTQWGENVIEKNPLYSDVLKRLEEREISRDDRVKLVTDVESLHSLNMMLNRTRRKDIQDFCIRRSFTVETSFTSQQYDLHNELLRFEYEALSKLHNVRSIPFMMSTIRRQAASCIFGLAPHIRNLITRRFDQMVEDPDLDIEEYDLDAKATSTLIALAKHVLELADLLPDNDPKLDSILKIIDEKQTQENNKIILFSSFRHTLNYLEKKLQALNYRIAQINGSIKDDDRRALRERFELDKDDPDALDMLLFTEVGSEGLDYQFCDTMINYDLPWNPMRIEQRIGRIDRRGQKSEAVNIYNIITADTVDADIYSRCLLRIGIFERSIGECEEVLGTIGNKIEQIVVSTALTDEERRRKLEQMADNEIRRMQELNKLEDEERALFGFDLSNYTAAKEIKDAESPWMSPANIQRLVERYLKDRLGDGQYIIGASELKQIRLSHEARKMLLDDFRKLSNIKSSLKRKWENYLKGSEPLHRITFISETASKEHRAFFITPMHPLVKQAAKYYATSNVSYIHLDYYSDDLPEGSYPFSLYTWSYVGLNTMFKVVPVCENEIIASELIDILQEADTSNIHKAIDKSIWAELEARHIALWQKEKETYIAGIQSTANYKLESISSSYRNRKRTLEQKIRDAFEEKIRRMYQGELNTATEHYQIKVDEINDQTARADIHTALIANGIIDIKRG
ncbi:MAG: DEAD/DEAH box helicase family protein [Ruminiclostridium sp.]|nr:DEAD/DEAH box helicase family protein [Ruminiclostridium sp.]